MGTDEADCHIN
jgi:hypothetical protein